MKYFWTHRDHIPEGLGYGQFTPGHFGWMAFTVLLTAVITIAYKGADPASRVVILRSIAAVLMASEIIKMILIALTPGVKVSEFLPLEMCSFAGYSVLLDSLFPDSMFFLQLLLILFLPAAIMAVFFPTTTTLPSFNFYSIHQFLFHGLIIAYVTARFVAGEIPMSYAGVWSSIGKILVLVGIVYLIDTVFHKNFMFLKDTYGNPMLGVIAKKTGEGVPYTLGLIAFSIFMVHVFFVIFKIIDILFIH